MSKKKYAPRKKNNHSNSPASKPQQTKDQDQAFDDDASQMNDDVYQDATPIDGDVFQDDMDEVPFIPMPEDIDAVPLVEPPFLFEEEMDSVEAYDDAPPFVAEQVLPPPSDDNKKGKKKKKKRHVFRTIFLTLFSLFIIALVGMYFVFDVANWQNLDISKITALAQTGSMYDAENNFITAIQGTENRTVVTLDQIPLTVQQAFLAAEDLRFYTHPGFDTIRIFGAIVENVKSGGYSQGASTITQQLIKLSHLSSQKTLARKLEEVWLAVQLDYQISKEQILEMYLNRIYFGNGAYGIQAASQTYFDVDVENLSLMQAAALAATIKAPSAYAPHLNPDNNKERRGYIINTMFAEEMIDAATRDEALNSTLVLAENEPVDMKYGWFIDAVLDEAEVQLGVSAETLLAGGYRIDTTLITEMQDITDNQYTQDIFPINASDGTKVQSATALVDIGSGAVRAVVGGREYAVRRGLNRATQLRRQPGSSLKPLAVFAPAIESYGYTTASVLIDEPTNFNGYKPRNSGYKYYGPVTIRTALRNSLNIAAVSLLNEIGVGAARDYLQKVGIPLDDRDSNLSLALGSMTYGVSPVQLAAAYSPFANGGIYYEPYFIEKITDSQGKIVYRHETEGTQVLSAQTAYLMTNLLQTVTASGTGAKLSTAGTPVAGKTGTVNMTGGGNRDVWMAAYNSEISTATWMGFDNPDANHKLQGWVSGGDNPAALARNIFRDYYKNKSKPQFARASGIISLELDKKAIEWRHEAMLAADLTPTAYRFSDVFSERNRPTKKSDVWNAPRTPNSFYISHNDAGNPLLVIQPAENAIYRVQRDAIGESFILTELRGTAGETLYFADKKATPGVVYTYRVIPVHAELLENGILLEGVQSVQVAQAKSGQSGSILEDMFGFLFGKKDSVPDTSQQQTENTSSLFWE